MRSIGDENIRSKDFCAKVGRLCSQFVVFLVSSSRQAQDVWVIEPASHEFLKDTGIEYSVTFLGYGLEIGVSNGFQKKTGGIWAYCIML